MFELKDLVEKDLQGFLIRTFYEVRFSKSEVGNTNAKLEVYVNKELATYKAQGAGWYGANGEAVEIYVIVAKEDPSHGIAITGLNAGQQVTVCNDQQERLAAIAEVLGKLSPADRAVLGHPVDDTV